MEVQSDVHRLFVRPLYGVELESLENSNESELCGFLQCLEDGMRRRL